MAQCTQTTLSWLTITYSLAIVALMLWRTPPLVARILCAAFLSGGIRLAISLLCITTSPLALLADDRNLDRITGEVRGPIVDSEKSRRFLVDCTAPARGLVWVTVYADSGTRRTAPIPKILPGDHIRVSGRLRKRTSYRNPGTSRWQNLIQSRNAALRMFASGGDVLIQNHSWSPWRWPTQVQRSLARRIARDQSNAAGIAVVRAMVVGDRQGLRRDIVQPVRAAGISHVLAVSGLHLAIVTIMVFAIVRRLWARIPWWRILSPNTISAITALVCAVIFTMVTGARVSTLRALLVATVVLLGIASARRVKVIDALGFAAICLITVTPFTVFDPSFQLSFSATAALALLVRPDPIPDAAPHWAVRLIKIVKKLMFASLVTAFATAPFTALAFSSVSILGVLTNVIAIPVAELVILPLGIAGITLGFVWSWAGGFLIRIASVGGSGLITMSRIAAEHVSPLSVPAPTTIDMMLIGLLWLAAIWRIYRSRPKWLVRSLAACAILGLAIRCSPTTMFNPGDLRIWFLDVGQGDAAVLQTPKGETWLIDGGGLPFSRDEDTISLPGRLAVVPFLESKRIRHIDLVMLSHPHPDHYAGLVAVSERFPIRELWLAKQHVEQMPNPRFTALLVKLALCGTRIVNPPLGVARSDQKVTLRVLGPSSYDSKIASVDPILSVNDNSLVVQVEYAHRKILFAGDLELEGEELLLQHHQDLDVDIVKVPHHGSNTSSSLLFVDATHPAWAVVSSGTANRFGFPSRHVAGRWQHSGARVLRTDQLGAILFRIAPSGNITISAFDGPK